MRSLYSTIVPQCISIGPGVMVRKFSHDGVIASRFAASEKKANTSSPACGNQSCDSKFRTRITKPIGFHSDGHFIVFLKGMPNRSANLLFGKELKHSL